MVDGVFATIIQNMQQMGFFHYLFPFLLALAILYGILKWAVGERIPKSAIALISLILSFFVMLFVSANPGVVSFLMNISGYWLIVGSGILFIIVLLGLVGVRTEKDIVEKSVYGKWVLILLIIAVAIFIFFGAGGEALVGAPSWAASSELWTVVFFVVILAVVLFMVGGEGEKKPAEGGKPA